MPGPLAPAVESRISDPLWKGLGQYTQYQSPFGPPGKGSPFGSESLLNRAGRVVLGKKADLTGG